MSINEDAKIYQFPYFGFISSVLVVCTCVPDQVPFCRRRVIGYLCFYKQNCRYHPDKNANDVKAGDMFKEVTFSYNILSDPDKRRQYDTAGFEVYLSELSLVFFFNNRILHWIILYIVSNFLYIYFLRLLNQKVKSWNWIFQV